ncbi:hypothetical protein F4780DRAFT_277961 [Xylariomycetidae sp. FL0641]|nr:hypothetical protein F4780DRAFT_277961 [Xylariomycetidae sp. FL0641]
MALTELFERTNDALDMNPLGIAPETLSVNASDWLWAVTALFIFSFLCLLYFSFTAPESDRVFHYLFTVSLLVGSATYFAAAADLGWDRERRVLWARYAYWAVAFPSAALALGLLSGVSWTTILTNVAVCWYWVLTYLASAYTPPGHGHGAYRWGFFAFGSLAYLILAASVLNESREAAARRGLARDYTVLAAWTSLLWALYPVAFGLGDGGGVIGVTGTCVFVGVLDLLMIPVLALLFVVFGRRWDYQKLHLAVSEQRYVPV